MAREASPSPILQFSTLNNIREAMPREGKKGSSRGGGRKFDTREGARLLGRLFIVNFWTVSFHFEKGGYFIWSPSNQNAQWAHCLEKGIWLSDFFWRGVSSRVALRINCATHPTAKAAGAPQCGVGGWVLEGHQRRRGGRAASQLRGSPGVCGVGTPCRFLGRLLFLNVPQLRHETICKGGEGDQFTL